MIKKVVGFAGKLLALALLVLVVIGAVYVVAAAIQDGTTKALGGIAVNLDQPALQDVTNTPTPEPPAPTPTPLPPTATPEPTQAPPEPTTTPEPTQAPPEPTDPPAPTPEPTPEPVDPNLTEVTLADGTKVMVDLGDDWETYPTAAMRNEFLTKVMGDPENPRPANRYKPVDFEVLAGETLLVFSEGSYVFTDGMTFRAIGGKGRENAVFVKNTDTVSMTYQLAGYASTGFSFIRFQPGVEPNYELWARYPLGRPTHCGIAGWITNGCSKVTLRVLTWDATGTSDLLERVFEKADALPIDNTALSDENSNADWESKSAAQALFDEAVLYSQPPTVAGTSASWGVTYSKPAVVVCQSGTIEGPDGSEVELENDTAVLWNNVGNTVVYKGYNLVGCTFYEYAPGTVPHPAIYARASIGVNGITSAMVHTMTYDLLDLLKLGTKVESQEYNTEALPR